MLDHRARIESSPVPVGRYWKVTHSAVRCATFHIPLDGIKQLSKEGSSRSLFHIHPTAVGALRCYD